jgi:hypothetical protein
MNKKNLLWIFLLIVVGISYYLYNMQKRDLGPVACTLEAKICPDGTVVGRSGPKCEFTACPTQSKSAHFNEKILDNDVYLTPLTLVSDSRCPKDIQCIWAGTVEIKVRLQIQDKTENIVLSLGKEYTFSGKIIMLTNVEPSKNSKETINNSDYIFEFSVNNLKK